MTPLPQDSSLTMSALQKSIVRQDENEPGSRTSSVPLLGEGFSEASYGRPTPSGNGVSEAEVSGIPETDAKSSKLKFWNRNKKREDDKNRRKKEAALTSGTPGMVYPIATMRPTSPLQHSRIPNTTSSPICSYSSPSSPAQIARSSSPRLSSPASSQIFERNVQEDGLAASASPAIPSHITTENHIPPVLDASSEAITDSQLSPDNVEIVMHSAHQPAAVTVTGGGTSEAAGGLWQDDLVAHPDYDDNGSSYGALDANDVRRLSFISFADVVHAEHAGHTGDASLLSGASSMSPALARSPSPVRSPVSSHGFSGSPTLSGSASLHGRGPAGSLSGHSPPIGGELTIETMRQALRKTGSGDLSGARSQPMSAVGGEDGTIEHPFK